MQATKGEVISSAQIFSGPLVPGHEKPRVSSWTLVPRVFRLDSSIASPSRVNDRVVGQGCGI